MAAGPKETVMPSPFPGMNPYLEQSDTWEDFHHNFMTRTQEMISGQLGPNYLVKIEVRLYLHELSAEERRFIGRANVGVTGPAAPGSSSPAGGVSAPVQLEMPAVDIVHHTSLEIRDRRNRRLVTAIELLSPSNKTPGGDRNDYLAKRSRLLAHRVHLVEIDLRRGGERPQPPELPPCDYYVLVARAQDWPFMGMWPISLRQRLPVVPIPLLAPDPDVLLDLQAVLDRTYDAADYGKYIIYGEEPEPPLPAEDAGWAWQFVPQGERRNGGHTGHHSGFSQGFTSLDRTAVNLAWRLESTKE
jgi:Protein of unknown function (DUF4058)